MRQKIFYPGAFALLLSLLFCACKNFSNLSMPEKVSIKTGAKYGVVLGEKYYSGISEKLGTELMETLRKASDGIDVYNYIPNPSDDTLQYLMHKKIYEVPLDIGEYLDKLDLDEIFSNSTDGIAFSKDITLPKINETKGISFKLSDITGKMEMSQDGTSLAIPVVPEPGTEQNLSMFFINNSLSNKVKTEFKYAKLIQFTSDSKVKIIVTRTDSNEMSDDFSINLVASIEDQSYKEATVFQKVEASSGNIARTGGVIELPLDDGHDGKLPSGFEVKIGGAYSGGVTPRNHSYQINIDMSGAKIKTFYKIDKTNGTSDTGDDMDTNSFNIPITQEISLGSMSDIIKSAVIGNGLLDIKVEKPAGWQGVELELESFSMTGLTGLNILKTDFVNTPGAEYLLDKVLKFEDIADGKKTLDFENSADKKITISGNVKVKLDDYNNATDTGGATIDLGASGNDTNLVGNVIVNVATIKSATADLSSLLKFEMGEGKENEKQLPESVIKYVSKIHFGTEQAGKYYKHDEHKALTTIESNGLGIKCKVLNTLPAGNDIPLQIKSDLFKMDSTDSTKWKDAAGAVIPSGAASAQQVNWISYPTIDFSGYTEPPYIDISVKALNSNQTLTNLVLGTTYNFGISDVEFVFDWDSVEMKFASAIDPVQDSVDLSDLSLSKLTEKIGETAQEILESVEIPNLPVYFYLQKPVGSLGEIIGEVSLKGIMSFEYSESGTPQTPEYIFGGAGEYESLNFSTPIQWPQSDTYEKDLNTQDYTEKYGLEKMLNGNKEDLRLAYDIKLYGGQDCVVYKAVLDNVQSGETTSIAIDVAIVLPFELKFKDSGTVDILKIAGVDNNEKKDLLGRSSVDSMEDYAEYCSAIKYVRLKYNIDNQIFTGANLSIVIDDTHEGEEDQADYSGIVKTVPLICSNPEEGMVEFKGKDIEKIFTRFFMPKILIKSESGTIKVSRSAIEQEKSIGFAPEVVIQLDDNSPICITDILKK